MQVHGVSLQPRRVFDTPRILFSKCSVCRFFALGHFLGSNFGCHFLFLKYGDKVGYAKDFESYFKFFDLTTSSPVIFNLFLYGNLGPNVISHQRFCYQNVWCQNWFD